MRFTSLNLLNSRHKGVPNLTSALGESGPVLVVGAGGIGCEVLHNLVLCGFTDIHVVDIDTVDLSNLNRQFLFREGDIGKPKSTCAGAAIDRRFGKRNVKITDYHAKCAPGEGNLCDVSFYQQFFCVILCLDNIEARRFLNEMLASIVKWIPNGHGGYKDDPKAPIIPFVDTGSEALQCNNRFVYHGTTSCTHCANIFKNDKQVPMCTLANVPRTPEHCVLFAQQKLWDDQKPFGQDVSINGDNLEHIKWIMDRAVERQQEFKLGGTIDITFAQGVVKNSVPTIGFTNAFVSSNAILDLLKHLSVPLGGVDLEEILRINPDLSIDEQVEPTAPFFVPAGFGDSECIGETVTLSRLAERFRYSEEELLAANPKLTATTALGPNEAVALPPRDEALDIEEIARRLMMGTLPSFTYHNGGTAQSNAYPFFRISSCKVCCPARHVTIPGSWQTVTLGDLCKALTNHRDILTISNCGNSASVSLRYYMYTTSALENVVVRVTDQTEVLCLTEETAQRTIADALQRNKTEETSVSSVYAIVSWVKGKESEELKFLVNMD